MANRLPPAPTNTVLARLVRRLIDSLPWVMARHLREARADLARVRALNADLRNENYDLRMDYENLTHGSSLLPAPEYVSLGVDQMLDEPALIFCVEYPRLRAAARIQRHDLRISGAAALALHQAAERVAQAATRTHRDALIQRALGGKTIDQVLKEKLHG